MIDTCHANFVHTFPVWVSHFFVKNKRILFPGESKPLGVDVVAYATHWSLLSSLMDSRLTENCQTSLADTFLTCFPSCKNYRQLKKGPSPVVVAVEMQILADFLTDLQLGSACASSYLALHIISQIYIFSHTSWRCKWFNITSFIVCC